ncbi:MAG: ethanolamine utilization protein EutN [bacterium]|nr:ethanolamine utilization protein EutN [bacterium]
MFLGRVIGTLVAAVVTPGMEGVPLLWVQPLDKRRQPAGLAFVCADGTRMAGPGELVYWEASREAALTLEPSFVPVDHAVVGLVDDVQLDEAPVCAPAQVARGATGAPARAPRRGRRQP